MTNFNSFQEFEFTAFSGSDLLQQGDTQLSCGDSFTMPFSATACITVTDNDRALSGDARRNEEGDDRSGQIADIELNGVEVADGVKIYAERFTVVRDEDGNTYKLIEIEIAGSPSDDNNDFFTFFGDVPPAGAQLTVVSTGNVAGNWLGYKHLSAGLKWDLDDDGKLTIEAEDMALKGYRVDDIDAASGGEVIKLKKKEGEAEITFGAQDGVYDLELAYVDENDGQGSIVVEVNGVVVQTIILDQDNNGNGNDHSTISTIKIDNLNLSQGDTITLRGERDQYEFARIDALTFCLNKAPDAVDDDFSIGESDVLIDDILGNDSDPDGDTIEIISADGNPTGVAFTVTSADGREAAVIVAPSGALNIAADTIGNFEDLALGETDTITLTYTISDGNGATDTADVTITINGENDGPVAVDDSFSIGESDLLVEDILGNDSDVDASDELTITEAESEPVGTLLTVTSTGNREAAVIVAPSGALNLAVDTIGNFEDLAVGETDTLTVTYTITDGNGGTDTATATITINGENDGPVAVDDSFTIGESEVLVDDILGNDSDVDASDELEVIEAEGQPVGTLINLTSAGGRSAAGIVAPSGALNLAVDTISNFEDLAVGETDTLTITYTITDGNGGTDTATATITINGENDGPVAVDDSFAIGESEVLVDDILGNDSDVDASDVVEIISAEGEAVGTLLTLTSAGGREAAGIVAASGDLNLAVDTIDNFEDLAVGETDTLTITYTITDGNGGTDTATATITINGENDGPVAVDDSFTIGESEVLVDDILGNNSDVDASDVVEIISAEGEAVGTLLTLTSAGGREAAGIVAASGDLNLAVDTIDNFEDLAVGETDTVTITYTISDGNSGTDTATATITINGENDGPVAVDDSFAIGESEVLVDDILGNDSDVDGTDVLEIIGAEGQAVGTLINLTSTGGREAAGIVAASGDLNIAVDTISNFEDLAVGETDTVTITYTISDGNSGTDTATATITINGENDGPVAVDDEFTFAEQEISVGNLLLNDSDVDASDVLQITSANGNAIDPALGGATLFNVLSSDGRNAEIVVTENFGFNVAFNPQEAFQDLAEGETDTVVFSYDITDNNGGTDTATVTITVEGENDGPVAVDDGFTIGESDVLVDDILGNDSDVDGTDVLEIIEAEGQAVGTLINLTSAGGRSAAGIVAPSGALNLAVDTISNFEDLALGETDTLTVSYTISDGNGGTDTATATITINGENDGPVAAGEAFAIGESDFESFDILSNETDVDATDTIEIIEAGGQATGTQIDVTSSSGRLAALIVAPSGMLNLAVDTIGNFEDLALGETDTLTLDYVISDGNGGSDTATTTITVNGENDGPVAVSEAFDITESAFETFDILGNDTDVDATDTLEIIEAEGQAVGTLINLTSAGGRSAAGIVAPSGDLNLAIDTIGNFEDLAEGETDTLTIDYVISDGNGGSDTATTTITVNGENDDPVAGDDAFSVDEGALLVEDLLGNDTDVDATDVLTITTANGNTVDPVTGAVFNVTSAGGREGAAIVASAGVLNVAFDQVGAFETLAEGETDTVTISYEISDGNGGTDTATATITVVGDGPATVSESFTANTPNTGQEVTISLTTDSTTSDGTVNAEIDINFGAELQPQINVVYVVDTSGSTVDSVLDIEKAALQSLTAEFAAQGFAEGSVSISIVPFSNTAAPDFTGDSVSTFVLDVTDDTTSTDVDDINDALDDLTGGGFSNFTDALDATVDVLTTLDPSNTETNIVYFLADGQPNRGGLTEADVAAAAVPLQAIAQVSAFEIGDADAFEFLDAIDNTGGAESVSLASDLSAALLGSPIPEGTVIDADLFIFDDSDVFGTLVQAIEIDVPGDTDDPANPNLVETLLGLELDLTLSGLASDLGDANRASLVVQFDDDGDGIVDLPLFVEVDIFGTA